jgi:hypothetical protein
VKQRERQRSPKYIGVLIVATATSALVVGAYVAEVVVDHDVTTPPVRNLLVVGAATLWAVYVTLQLGSRLLLAVEGMRRALASDQARAAYAAGYLDGVGRRPPNGPDGGDSGAFERWQDRRS